jgi:hypothetical protein
MPKRPQTAAPFALKCALLFLAFSVFGFGLNAKLSQYRANQSPDTVAAAKLSAEKRTAQSTVVTKVVKEPREEASRFRLFAFTVFQNVISSPAFKLHQVEVSLCNPCRCDSRSPSLMNLPPPALS